MEFDEVIRRRAMVRSYLERPVPVELRDKLIKAALRSPSAGFTQGISLLITESDADRARFWSTTSEAEADHSWLRGMRTAPLLILVWASRAAYLDRYAQPDKGWTDRDLDRWSAPYWYVDAGMASMAALLAAVDNELGACFFGIPPERIAAVRSEFGVPPEQLSIGVISVGYSDRSVPRSGSPRTRARLDRAELVHFGHWEPLETQR